VVRLAIFIRAKEYCPLLEELKYLVFVAIKQPCSPRGHDGMACIRLIFLLLLVSGTARAETELNFDEKNGLFTVRENTANLVTTDFVFWKARWKWAGARVQTSIPGPLAYRLEGNFSRIGLNLKGEVRRAAPNKMVWNFDLATNLALKDAIGGGIVFKLNPEALRRQGQTPELLPGNAGWRIRAGAGGGFLTVRFDPPAARVFFERGKRREIRAFFYDKGVMPGHKQLRMTVTLPRDGQVAPTLSERLGPGPDKTWYNDVLYWATSPVDLSFLNETEKPAGKHGFLAAVGEDLVFADGSKAKFWGANIQAGALFRTNSVDVRKQARRLSRLGFNLIRIHHHDSPWVQPNIFGKRSKNTLRLDEAALKKLDWWIKCLRDEGIYVWLDLHVERAFTRQDGIGGSAEISDKLLERGAKGFNYVNEDIQRLMRAFNEAYLNHVNPNTGLAYKDDPAIIAVLVSNENDLTRHFGNRLLPDKKVPVHNALYMAEAAAFAARNRLPVRQTWRSWEHGPAKIFLNDLEHRFNDRMRGHLDSIGIRVPVVTTQSWGRMPVSSLPALSDSDIIDVHSYGGPNQVEANPRYRAGLLSWIAAAQVTGKPLSISEWNLSPFPAFDRSYLPLQVAAAARLQAWDASMHYGYAQSPLNAAGHPSNWQAFNDPAMLAMMPAAALIYRQGHVRQAEKTYALKLDPRTFYYRKISPETSLAIRTIAEQSRLVIELPETPALPWLEPAKSGSDVIIVTDPDQNFLPKGQNFLRSDTGEIYRNWEDGIFTVDTDRSQVAAGWLGGKSVVLQDISVDLVTSNAAVAVQSLTGQPIRDSNSILISLAARSIPSPGNKLPFLSEPVVGKLRIRAPEGLQLFALDRGGRGKPVAVIYTAGHYLLELDHQLGTYWLKLHAPDNGTGPG
jgi:hypothetical protein